MTAAVMTKPAYSLVDSLEQLKTLFDHLINDRGIFAFDIETGYPGEPRAGFSLHPETAFVVGFSFCSDLNAAYYVALNHDMGEDYNLPVVAVAEMFWQVLRTGRGIPHNAKFELRQLASFFRKHLSNHPLWGEEVRASEGYYPVAGDTFLMAYCVAEHQQFGLKYLTKVIYNHQMTELLDLFTTVDAKTGKLKQLAKNQSSKIRFNKLELTQAVIEYACEDAYWTFRLKDDLPQLLLQAGGDVYTRKQNFDSIYALEMNTLRSVCAMEDFGIAVDWGMIKKAAVEGAKFKDALNAEIQQELTDLLGRPIDINLTSPPQMSALLYNTHDHPDAPGFGLKTNRYTKSTKHSANPKMAADAQVLKTLSEKLPVLKKVIQWREMKTLLTRYLTNYENDYSYAEDGNLHPDLFSAGTITGRFSAAHPNYQQLPKRYYFKLWAAKLVDKEHEDAHGDRFPVRDERPWRGIEVECPCGEFPYPEGSTFDFNFRLAIIAPKGWRIFGFDYSQAELRAIAGEAHEDAMMEAFLTGVDIHLKTASMMLRKPLDLCTKADRNIGKTMNFAICYGMSAKSLAERLGKTEQEANELFQQYFDGFPNLKKWQDDQVKKVRQGYVYSKFGRRIPLWDLLSKERWIRSKADRVAVNGPIQGGATGDNVKRVMAEVHAALWASEFRDTVKMVMNIHDALEFYVKDGVDLDAVFALLKPIVCQQIEGWAPLVADWHVGTRWGDVEDLKEVDGKLVSAKQAKEREDSPSIVPTADHEHPNVAFRAPEMDDDEEPVEVELPSRTVVVQAVTMPTRQQHADFVALLRVKTGVNRIKLVVPGGTAEGGQAGIPETTGLSPADGQEISLLLQGARVYYASDTVDKKSFLDKVGL